MKKGIFIVLILGILAVVIYSVITQVASTVHLGGIFSMDLLDYSVHPATTTQHVSVSVNPDNSSGGGSSGGNSGGGNGQEQQKPQITPPAGFTLAQLSPYYQKLRLSNVVAPRSYYDPTSVSQFSLQASFGTSTMAADVTGWQVKGNSGTQAFIPKAVGNYNIQAFGTPYSSDIVLHDGELLTVYSTASPVGVNLRLNKCTGYLGNQYRFSPSLPQNCPAVDRALVSTFSGECQSYIFSLYGCAEPTPNDKNRLSYDNACLTFLNKLNYQGCYTAHRGDADFLGREWRAWIDHEMPFNSQHDRILLLDKNGLLVDIYTY